jgi:hypothetical protein
MYIPVPFRKFILRFTSPATMKSITFFSLKSSVHQQLTQELKQNIICQQFFILILHLHNLLQK